MSRFPLIQSAEATGAAAEALGEVRRALGSVPNMAKVMANSPALVKGWLALSGALSGTMIPVPVRERLASANAEYNNCTYCLSAHTYIGARVAEVGAGGLGRARRASPPSRTPPQCWPCPRPLPAATSVRRSSGLPGPWASPNAEIAVVVGNLALNILTNYFNVLADTDIEWPVVTLHTDA
ncbi:carboxymuconolactone decarboxylase family protein [Streptomyces sp. NPDC093984]|uniref:carboxymuconolactone decarboxylase family protein n=1 Tax=Streptomyces sp. NPDC093984 TaxID=3366052 RepID=UPI003817C1C5